MSLATVARRVGRRALAWYRRGLLATELGAAGVVLILELTGSRAGWMGQALFAGDLLLIAAFALRLASGLWQTPRLIGEPRVLAALPLCAVLAFVSPRLAAAVALTHDSWLGLLWASRLRSGTLLVAVRDHPARALVLSFVGLIAVGTFLLFLPAASAGPSVGAIDALFTAVSATCVTGLTTLDTATTWSVFGKGVIVVLIQLGGLGMMTITGFMTVAVGRALGLRRNMLLRGAFDEPDASEMRVLLKAIAIWTLVIEIAGALLLLVRFVGLMPLGEAIAYAAFHSISAFCNAGFSLYSDNLVRFAEDPLVTLVISGLVVAGGLGFGVLVAVFRFVLAPRRARLPLHAKLALVTSLLLIWGGALAFFFLEYDRTLAPLSLGGKLLASVFHSVSARTAGFNSVSFAAIDPATVLLLIVLMFIGASPSSTGGGIKTTTFAVVLFAVRAIMLDRTDVVIFGRRISQDLILRALALTGVAAMTLAGAIGLLLTTEHLSFDWIAFEATSAMGTVGLSLGATPMLSPAGRLIISALMFIGRVGPLTIVAAIARVPRGARVGIPEGRVLVG